MSRKGVESWRVGEQVGTEMGCFARLSGVRQGPMLLLKLRVVACLQGRANGEASRALANGEGPLARNTHKQACSTFHGFSRRRVD